jgi:hypothetical protein
MKEEKVAVETSLPALMEDTCILAEELLQYTPRDLETLMGISTDLAEKNFRRFQEFHKAEEYPAIYLFRGDVYRGLEADSLSREDILFLNHHLRILSGLYGILKPLDRIRPYRLEMGIGLKNIRGRNLYAFWGDRIQKHLEQEADDGIIVNLASREYAKAVISSQSSLDVYQVDFREKRDTSYRTVALFSKIARGQMSRYIAKNRIDRIDDLKEFNESSYSYQADLSDSHTLVFTR